ncbi:unnamed protein product, partial [Darwinula stevensoni]
MADAFEREAIFKREADLVARNIRKISQNAKHIEKVSQYSKGSVDDLRKEHEVLHETKKLAEETKKKLEDMKTSLSQGTFQNQRQAKHQHEKLTDEFTSACTTLQSVQRDLVSKEKEQVRRVRAQSGTRPPECSRNTRGKRKKHEIEASKRVKDVRRWDSNIVPSLLPSGTFMNPSNN